MKKWGQVPVVVTADARGEDLAELRALARQQIGVAAQPARIVRVPQLPRLASGKPDRRAIAECVASAR